jgi:hypothetical protein
MIPPCAVRAGRPESTARGDVEGQHESSVGEGVREVLATAGSRAQITGRMLG